MRNILLAAVSAFALSTHRRAAAFAADPPSGPAANKPMYGDWGVDLTAGDKPVAPGADFDKYANGAWAACTRDPRRPGLGRRRLRRLQPLAGPAAHPDRDGRASTQIGALLQELRRRGQGRGGRRHSR